MRRIYLDYAASTPVDPRVFKVMRPYFEKEFGNPGSLHSFGQKAIAAVDAAREKIAQALGVSFREIIFTGSATEANNLALQGAVQAFRRKFPGRAPEVVVSAIEHESVLETARELGNNGAVVKIVPVNTEGIPNLKRLKDSLSENTAVVSVMYGNNETGTVEPVEAIGAMARNFRGKNIWPVFHTDAAQAFQYLDSRPEVLHVDLLTISGHKLGGPKGIGALYINERYKQIMPPLILGGGQEWGLRSATENVPAIAGFGEAVDLSVRERHKRTLHAEGLKKIFAAGIRKIKGVEIRAGELPHILNFSVPGTEAGDMLAALDQEGLAISTGAACSSRALHPSHVLRAMGLTEKEIRGSFRVSFGPAATSAEVSAAVRIFEKVFRQMNPVRKSK